MATDTPASSDHGPRAVERRVVDRLPDSFALERSEAEWLLTLLSAEQVRYIFEGPVDGEGKG